MSEQTTPPSGSTPAAPAGGRSTPAPPPAAKKKGPSKGAKVAGGVAAAAAAVAAGLAYGDEIANAASGDPDAVAAPGTFDAAGPVGTPLVETPAARGGATGGGSPSEAAPRQARRADSDSATTASASQPAAHTAQTATPAVDADFEAARSTLLARLDNFEAPAGTSPEDAAQLRQDLIDAVTDFNPSPGQTTQEALAALRNEYDDQLQDFTQDQKIDALVQEAQRDNEAEAAAQAGATPAADPDVDPEVDPEVDNSGEGTDASVSETGVASDSFVLMGDVMQTAQLAPTGQQAPAADAGTPQIGREVPVGRGFRDDFDVLIAQPAPAEALGRSGQDVAGKDVAGGSLDVNIDEDRPSHRREVADGAGLDVSATPQPAAADAVDVVPAELIDVAMAAPASLAHDVLGVVVPVASTDEAPLEMAGVDLGEPIVVDAQDVVEMTMEENQVIDLVEIAVDPLAVDSLLAVEPIPTPVDEPVMEDADFAAVLANEITPARPDNLSFEP